MKNILVLINIALTICCFYQIGASQSADDSDLKKYEIGGQFTLLRRSNVDTSTEIILRNDPTLPHTSPAKLSELGIGGRFTYNFTKNIAVEAEANFFPDDKRSNPIIGVPIRIIEPGGRKFQAVLGPKIGIRKKKFGVFAKVRPGLFSMDRYDVVILVIGTPTNLAILSETKNGVNFFSVDVGGVFEYYPSRRKVFRVDVGDTIIRYGAQEPKNINPNITRNNLQVSVGFGFRF